MGGVRRRRAERPLDNLGHLIVRERSRPSRPRLIRQPLDALLQEAAGEVGAWPLAPQPLTAPKVRPWTSFFWMKKMKTRTGMLWMIDAAAT